MTNYFKICNECLDVWHGEKNRCPVCGSSDFDMDDDYARFDGGLDSD